MYKFNIIRYVIVTIIIHLHQQMQTIHKKSQFIHIRESSYIIAKINLHHPGDSNTKEYKINTFNSHIKCYK